MRAPLRITATRHPRLIEIDARAWLARLSARDGRRVSLGDVRARDIDPIAELGFDLVWLTATWTTGSAAAALSRASAALRERRAELLPDGSDDDIVGSPYAISAYEPADSLGGAAGLARFRQRLAEAGHRADPRLRPEPRLVGAPLGPSPPRLVRPRRPVAAGGRPRRVLRGPLRRPPLDRPWPRPALPAVAGYGPARLPPSRGAAGDDPGAQGGRHALRRGRSARRRCSSSTTSSGRPGAAGRRCRRPPRMPRRSASSGGTPRAPSARSTRSSCSSARPTGATSGASSSSASTTPGTSRWSTGWWPATSASVAAHLRADDAYQRRSVRLLEDRNGPRIAAAAVARAGPGRRPRRGDDPGHAARPGRPDRRRAPGRPDPVPPRAGRGARRGAARLLLPAPAGDRRRDVPARPRHPARTDAGVAGQRDPRGHRRPAVGRPASPAPAGRRQPDRRTGAGVHPAGPPRVRRQDRPSRGPARRGGEYDRPGDDLLVRGLYVDLPAYGAPPVPGHPPDDPIVAGRRRPGARCGASWRRSRPQPSGASSSRA